MKLVIVHWNWLDHIAADGGNGGGHGGGDGGELASVAGSYRNPPFTHLHTSVSLSQPQFVLDIW